MRKGELTEILTILHRELSRILGEKLDAIYLYGSQARGDASPGSDVDVLIVLQGNFDYFQMLDLTSEPTWKLSLENDIVISRVFVSKEQFDLVNTPFLMNVHREIIAI